MKRLLRNAAREMLSAAVRPLYAGIGCIFALHRVAGKSETARVGNVMMEIAPEDLQKLIEEVLGRGYDIVALDDVHQILNGQRKNKRFAAFTFDDGYLDNYTLARPIFARYKAPFAVYIATSFVSNTNALWWYRLEHLVLHRRQLAFSHDSKRFEFDLSSAQAKEKAFDAIATTIRQFGTAERRSFLENLFAGETDFTKTNLMMNWNQVKELASDPQITIGAHTVGHYDLNKLTDAEALHEITESRRIIAERTGCKVEHFSYPFGGRNAVGRREFDLLKSSGFKTGVTTRTANIFPEHRIHQECLPRLILGNNYPVLARFKALESGLVPMRQNGLQRVVTV